MSRKADEIFKQALQAAYEADMKALDEEMKDLPPHQFSPEFEAKMNELLASMRNKKRWFSRLFKK